MPTSSKENPLAVARQQIDEQALRLAAEFMPLSLPSDELHNLAKDLIAAALILTKRPQQGIDCHAATLALEDPKLTDRDTWRSLASSPFDVIARTGCTMFLCNADRRSSALALAHHLLTASPTTVIP